MAKSVSPIRQHQCMTVHFHGDTVHFEQLTHTLNMTLRNAQNIWCRRTFSSGDLEGWGWGWGWGIWTGGGGLPPSSFVVLMRPWGEEGGECRFVGESAMPVPP